MIYSFENVSHAVTDAWTSQRCMRSFKKRLGYAEDANLSNLL